MLFGRDHEISVIDRAVRAAQSGSSAVVTILGEPGIGKTSLLEYAVSSAEGFRVLSCWGTESEAELPFAALHQLLHPYLDHLADLPRPQTDAMLTAFGLGEDTATTADRLMVGVAALTLLSDLASEDPVLCEIDDAQWLDRESCEALLFVSRRLLAEGIVILGASREPTPPCLALEPPAVRLPLARLGKSDAERLIVERAGELDTPQRTRLITEAEGNPLTLIELAKLADGPDADSMTTEPIEFEGRVSGAFWRQIQQLPDATRTALSVAAANDSPNTDEIVTAARRLGAGLSDLKPAEEAGLIRLDGSTLTFRHPLVRTTVKRWMPGSDRITAHRALAEVLTGADQADRRAWHLTAAATGPNAEAADALAETAARARLRGGYAASATAYERAARLTADPSQRGRRLAAAAADARIAGELIKATELVSEATPLARDPDVAAGLETVRARVDFENGKPSRGAEIMMGAAATLRASDPTRAAMMLIEAVRMSHFADVTPNIGQAADLIESLLPEVGDNFQGSLRAASVLARLLAGVPPDRLPPLHRVLGDVPSIEDLGWLVGTHSAEFLLMAGHPRESYDLTALIVGQLRSAGMIGALPHTLLINGHAALLLGRIREAYGTAVDGVQISEASRQFHSAANLSSLVALAAAMAGDEDQCAKFANTSIRYGIEHGTGSHVGMSWMALCLFDLGNAQYESAFNRLENLGPELSQNLLVRLFAPPEQIEAAVRTGRADQARELLADYERLTSRHQDSRTARAIAQRCDALLSRGNQANDHFRAALEMHRQATDIWSQARTQMLYGEWLRRERRRTEARFQLRAAMQTFDAMGARAFADRARSELRAAGEAVPSPDPSVRQIADLTPQELQVARLAASGLTNRDIGGQLFMSPRTVGYHLYKIFPKLRISARAELAKFDFG